MPAPDEPYYCSQQIDIPPEFPDILKQFTKAAVRTQPKDALAWAAAYFKAMANGEVPPVKERLEMPVASQKTDSGLSPGIIRIMNKQLGTKQTLTLAEVEEKWLDLSLPKESFDDIVRLGGFTGSVEWNHFLALCCSAIAENITESMKTVCEILSHDPEGGAARVPFNLWKGLYQFLAKIDGKISREQIDMVLDHLRYDVEKQDGFVMPRNFLNSSCPRLS